MASHELVSLDDAKIQLKKLMNDMTKSEREHLLSHAIQECMTLGPEVDDSDDENFENNDEDFLDDPVSLLNSISRRIIQETPPETIISLNNSTIPEKSDNPEYNSKITKNPDAFLYEDEVADIDDSAEKEKLQEYYCRDCKSTNIASLKFQSYSLSKEDLYEVFNDRLPTLDGKIVVDVGSRIGTVLYGAYAYTDAAKIIGVEVNKDYCKLQNSIIEKFKMGSRIEIINGQIENAANHLKTADVVTLIHAFEFQMSKAERNNAWKLMKKTVKRGALIVSRPSIATSLASLDTGINVNDWVKQKDSDDQVHNSSDAKLKTVDEYSKIFFYEVL